MSSSQYRLSFDHHDRGPAPRAAPGDTGVWVNDVQSRLNATRVRRVAQPASLASLVQLVHLADGPVAVCGGRHSMGGQQFASDGDLVDMSAMDRVLDFDRTRGLIEVEAGIRWPALIDYLLRAQEGLRPQWGIRQKQTGTDQLSVGGALAANAHGRGMTLKPIVGDVESFVLIDCRGDLRRCSRTENPELFALAIGGYGLFGIVASVTLRLTYRRKLERVVEVTAVDRLAAAFERRIEEGFLYGDFQYAIDPGSDAFLAEGIFSCYRPVDAATPVPEDQNVLAAEDWLQLAYLAHVDKQRAFELYARHYLATSGQIYWSDTHQQSLYLDDYHVALDRRLGAATPASELLAELYVPRGALADFLGTVRADFRRHGVDLIYGTIRLIERDDESFLAWAGQAFACVTFNLHVAHERLALEKAAADMLRLIDRAIQFNGSFYLAYHRLATRQRVEACYPQFAEFLRLKRRYDPRQRFQSDWYRHYRQLFAAAD